MGADLYIHSIQKVADAKHKPLFDAAVAARDKYNHEHPMTEDEQKAFNKWQWDGGKTTDGIPAKNIELQEAVGKHYDAMFPPDGYFRDSYNNTSLFWRLGLSWWTDIIPMCDDEGYLPIEGVKDVKVMVAEAWEACSELTLESLKEGHCLVDDDENNLESWKHYYEDKYRKFMCFLATAIRLDEPISCSL